MEERLGLKGSWGMKGPRAVPRLRLGLRVRLWVLLLWVLELVQGLPGAGWLAGWLAGSSWALISGCPGSLAFSQGVPRALPWVSGLLGGRVRAPVWSVAVSGYSSGRLQQGVWGVGLQGT